ncbi:MAG: DUF58 domain-containing protein [Gammaproteobacteria bacterium]
MRPAPRQLQIFGLLLALGTMLVLLPNLLVPWLLCAAVLAGLSLGDAFLLWRRRTVRAERNVNPSLALGVTRAVGLRFFNEDEKPLSVEVYDHHPATVNTSALPLALSVAPGHWQEASYDITPLERGRHEFGPIDLRVHSPLRFWSRRCLLEADETVSVFPNFAAVTKYAILGLDAQTATGGLQLRPRRGEGSEFHQLREYRVGDTFRQIDWKASARLSKLIAKEYQEERDQQIVFMVDTGRRMLAREDGLSHFDHVLNSMLLLSYVALRQGDAVGFMTCGSSTRWMKPRKGLSTMSTLTRQLFDLQPEELAVDYQAAATQLAQYQKRRALIVLLTNIRDEDSDDLKVAFGLLRKRHVLLVASLREPGVDDLLENDVIDFDGARDFASAHHYLAARRSTLDRLRARGVVIEDTSCAELPRAIANRYLDIKRAGVL